MKNCTERNIPSNLNDDLNNRLTSIFETINNIKFDSYQSTKNNFQLENNLNLNTERNENNLKNEEENFKSNNEGDDFLLKLKIFDALKKYYLKRKAKKPYLLKKQRLKEMADSFYSNLLKSRTFFGFFKILKRKSYYNMIKENYIDFRINELSKTLIHGLVYSYNRYKLVKNFQLNKEKKIKKYFLLELKNTLSYQKTYEQFLLGQIYKNPFATDFMLMICNKGIDNIKIKNKFNTNFQILRSAKIYNEKKRLFKLFCYLIYNSSNDFYNKNKILEYQKQRIIMYIFFKKLKYKLMIRYRKSYFYSRLFFKNIYKLVQKKLKKNQIILKLLRNDISNLNNKSIESIFYEKCLYKKIFNLLKTNSQEQKRKILKFKEKIIIKNISSFYRKCILKTIKCLIKQGIRQKVNNYRRLYFLKIIFKCSIFKFRYIKCLKIREKYLKKNGLKFIKNNVEESNKEAKNIARFYFNLFLMNYVYKITYKQRKKDNKKNAAERLILNQIKNKIKNKKNLKLKILSFKKKNNLKEIRGFYKLFKKKKNNDTNEIKIKYDSKPIKIFGKNFINRLLKEHRIKKSFNKYFNIHFIKIYQTFVKNINYKIINNSLKIVSKQIKIRNIYYNFLDEINKKFAKRVKYKRIKSISKKLIGKKFFNIIILTNKMKNLSDSLFGLYKARQKKKCFYELKKRYLDKIKYSMLACRFNEYLIFSSLKKITIEYSKRHKK